MNKYFRNVDWLGISCIIFVIALICACVFGYGANLYKLFHMVNDWGTQIIIRIIGIFIFPLGIVLGYI